VVGVVRHPADGVQVPILRRPMRIASVLTAVTVLWFIVRLLTPVGPVVIGWLPGVVVVFLVGAVCLATARRPGVSRTVARFWTAIAVGAFFVGLGTLARALRGLEPGADAHVVGVPDMVLYLCAVTALGWALFRLPLGVTDAGQRWRFWLDLSTVMVSTALFFWYLSVRPSLGKGHQEQAAFTGLVVSALVLVLAFAVVKVILTGAATIPTGSLRPLGLALLIGTVASAPEPLLPTSGPSMGQLVVPVTGLLAVVAASRQFRVASERGATKPQPTRRFSVLPYSAVAASGGLLMYTAVLGRTTDRVIVAGAVVCLVGLVTSRQVLALADNSRLVTQLDVGMAALAEREQRFRALVRN